MSDDDLEMEEWMALTEAQKDAQLQRVMRELEAYYDTLSPLEYYRVRRRRMLQTIAGWRELQRDPRIGGLDVYRQHLRKMQLQLAKLRVLRATGAWPGSA